MSISGTTFNNDFASGNHVDFGPGTGGMEDLFKSDYTIAVLARFNAPTYGLFGGFSELDASVTNHRLFIANNSGGRMFGHSDFSDGWPDPSVDADGLDDDVWRWLCQGKVTGSAKYRMHFADLETLTWSQGISDGAENHSDPSADSVMFSTWALYGMGLTEGATAYICVWPTALTDLQIRNSCTQSASDLLSQSAPIAMYSFKQSEAGSTIVDLTGNGADEIDRQNITTSADPGDFDFTLAPPFDATRFFAVL